MLLTFFPSPYKDELLYSILARFHVWSSNVGFKQTLMQLFGKSSICSIIFFPCHLERMSKNLPEGSYYLTERIIENNTLFPIFRPFLPSDRAEKIIKCMIGEQGNIINQIIGTMASSIPMPKYLRYCQRCVDVDVAEHGEAYWHRVHQVSGVTACSKHLCRLSESPIRISPPENKTAFHSIPSEVYSHRDDKIEDLGFPHGDVAQAVQWILDNNVPFFGLERIRNQYIAFLQKADFATFTGRVMQAEMAEAINNFYSPEFLNEVYSPVNKAQSDTWLARLLRKQRTAAHPIHHILLMLFLGITPEVFFTRSFYNGHPFGEGPWPCLNPVCELFKQNVINSCQISRDSKTGQPVGTFSCQCGFTYARSGPDKDYASRYKIGRIKSFGKKWRDTMIYYLVEEKSSLRETARRLGVDPGTVKYQAAIALGEIHNRKKLLKNSREQKLELYRAKWQLLIRLHPDEGKAKLRTFAPSVYYWLYRNDRTWLMGNSPPSHSGCKITKPRIDWNERDEKLSKEIADAGEVLRKREPLVRITVSSLGKCTGYLSLLHHHLNKLPRTKLILELIVESISEYQERRVLYTVKKLKKTGTQPVTWKVMKLSGLKKGYEKWVQSLITDYPDFES